MSCRPRSLRSILTLPLDDQEERQARQYINRETAAIRSDWSEEEFRQRAGLPIREPPFEFPTIAEPLDLLDHDVGDD